MDYFHKYETNPFDELAWNIPDQKQGSILVMGGNNQNFRTVIKTAENISTNFPVKELKIALPKSLEKTLPPVDNLVFLPATDSGSFAESEELKSLFNLSDFNLLVGDFSKNNITARAIAEACEKAEKPTLLTRDTIDIILSSNLEPLLMNEQLCYFAPLPSLQKLFRAVYYPKVILLSQPLMQIAEALHKFTLSYPASIITLHNGQILVAKNGNVSAVPIEKTAYTPLTLWMGEAASKIAVFNLYNPNQFENATISALF